MGPRLLRIFSRLAAEAGVARALGKFPRKGDVGDAMGKAREVFVRIDSVGICPDDGNECEVDLGVGMVFKRLSN